MGTFIPNIANAAIDGQDTSSTPLYIYETQILDFQQPKGGDDTVVLDLKLQSPEGRVYAEFSYKFVQEDKFKTPPLPAIAMDKHLGGSRGRSNTSHASDLTVERSKDRRRFTSTAVPPSRNELASPLRKSATLHEEAWEGEAGDDDDGDFEQARGAVKPPGDLDIVAEEPDAGEHFMQATSAFFSKMGYWLYNSKVVQYIARDDRVRTKTAFPAEDIWMLGVCYSFEDREQTPTQVAAIKEDEKESESPRRQNVTETQESQVPTPPPSQTASLQEEEEEEDEDEERSDALESLPAAPFLNGTISQATQEPGVPPFPKSGQMSQDRLRYSPSMSLSHFAAASPRRSAATSSISCHEAQSHSHSRSASANTTTPLLVDVFKQPVSVHGGSASSPTESALSSTSALLTGGVQPSANSTSSQPSTPTLVSSPKTSSLLGNFSKLGAEQHQHASPSRKPGKRRMTITELFSWDSNSTASAGTSNNPDNLNGNSSSVSALKNLMNSSKNGSPSQTVPGLGTARSSQMPKVESESTPTDLVPPMPPTLFTEPTTVPTPNLGKVKSVPIPETPIPETPIPETPETPIPETPIPETPIPETPAPAQDVSSTHNSDPSTNNDTIALQQPDQVQKRDRKRKTSRTLVASIITVAPETSNQVASKTDTHGLDNLSTERDRAAVASPKPDREDNTTTTSSRAPPHSLPSPLRTGLFSSKRQNSMPASPSKSPQHADSSTPPPPSSPPGSSLRRSWRSLSLTLVTTAKSTLPFGLSSPIRSRSPGFFNQQQQKQSPVHEATGFGHEYDYSDDLNDSVRNENSALISLPPGISAYMSVLRPSPSTAVKNLTREQEVLRQFLMDFQSRFWFMYRKDLVRIEPSFYTCDSGWGCMMRTGQSLLAQGFVQVLLGREWRAHLPQTQYSQRRYKEILGWFVDEPEHPYSIHRIAKAGLALDKRIGEWFGPSTVAHALKRLSQKHEDCPLAILVPMDGTIRVSSIIQAATHTQSPPATLRRSVSEKRIGAEAETAWKPVLLMIPTRFGLDKLTAKYTNNLKQLFKIPQFLGIAGGRPGEELFYYDPHFVKPRASAEELSASPVPSFHCPVVRSMDILELDPSMLLGFLIQSRSELEDLKTRLGRDMEKAYPLMTIQDDTQIQPPIAHTHKPSTPRQQHIKISSDKGRERERTRDTHQHRGEARGNILVSTSPLSCSPAPSSPVSALPNRQRNLKDQDDAFSIKSMDSDGDGYDEE
ncbi:Cysteine protease atg4a [Dissophora ornata]|nr:Cysteine protease atg4a [Dissophora ornata]